MRLSVKALLALNRCFPRIEHPFNMQNEGRQTYAEWQFSQGARTLECFLPEMTPADILAGKEVLDMGCGAAGKSLYYVSAGAKHVTGVEMVEHYRAEAEALAAKIREIWPSCDIRIGANRGLCSYYCEPGGVLVGFEG